MLKALEQAIVQEGGDPAELERIREARKLLREYRRLRAKLGLPVQERTKDREDDVDKERR